MLTQVDQLTDGAINNMDARELANAALLLQGVEVQTERIRLKAMIEIRAKEVDCLPTIKSMFSAFDKYDKQLAKSYSSIAAEEGVDLVRDAKGVPLPTIENMLRIMRADDYYKNICFNLMTNNAEVHYNGEIIRWADTDTAASSHYIEAKYGIYSEHKHLDALRILFREREYNPILRLVDSLEWDGVERCEQFLTKWAKADDTAYAHEVSRLIFSGGVNRLYLPGCKFDDVPILIGTNQGEGKSTLVKWLAIHDSYFSEVTDMDGQRGIEQLEGAWICEIAELLALTKTKEQEAVKSYITRQRDKYRRPYDRQTSEFPRRCMFIGTTNNRNFLKDKTGNRRFYPVEVHSVGYDLYDHEQECRDYIIQCWAEAAYKYKQGKMPAFADKSLLDEFKAAQDESMEDDWRIGALENYLNSLAPGEVVCIRQLKREALSANADRPEDPTPKEAQEISVMMNKFPDWERTGRIYTAEYGRQRCWRRKNEGSEYVNDYSQLPF